MTLYNIIQISPNQPHRIIITFLPWYVSMFLVKQICLYIILIHVDCVDCWKCNESHPQEFSFFFKITTVVFLSLKVSVFGYGADKYGNWHHYWENNRNAGAFRKTGVHNAEYETLVIQKLYADGKITLFRWAFNCGLYWLKSAWSHVIYSNVKKAKEMQFTHFN